MNTIHFPNSMIPTEGLKALLADKGHLPIGHPEQATLMEWLVHILVHRSAMMDHFAYLQSRINTAETAPPVSAWDREQLLKQIVEKTGFTPHDKWDCLEMILEGGPNAISKLSHGESLLLDVSLLHAIAEAIDTDMPPAWQTELDRDIARLGFQLSDPLPGAVPRSIKGLLTICAAVFSITAAILLILSYSFGLWSSPNRFEVIVTNKTPPTVLKTRPEVSAEPEWTILRGVEQVPQLKLTANFDGFASVVSLKPGQPGIVFPREGKAPVHLRAGVIGSTGAFPEFAQSATHVIAVFTRTDARASIDTFLERQGPVDSNEKLLNLLREHLRSENYEPCELRLIAMPPKPPMPKAAIPPAPGVMPVSSILLQAAARPAKPYFYNRVVCLCIGVNSEAPFLPLKFAEADAKKMAKLFDEDYGYETITLLGQKATAKTIRAKLEDISKDLDKSDMLIVYFAGHGVTKELPNEGRTGFFIAGGASLRPTEADLEVWRKECIEMSDIVSKLRETKAQHTVLIADACYSGLLLKRAALPRTQTLVSLLTGRSQFALTATTDKQEAGEDPNVGGGYFTDAFYTALKRGEVQELSEVARKARDIVRIKANLPMLPLLAPVSKFVSDGEPIFFPLTVDPAKIKVLQRELALALKGERPRPDDTVIASILLRTAEAKKNLTTTAQVLDAYHALNPEFTADPVAIHKFWKPKLERFHDNVAVGDPLAMAALVYCYSKGLGTTADKDKAFQYARLAADTDDSVGYYMLGKCFNEGIGKKANKVAASRYFGLAAKSPVPFPVNYYMLAIEKLQSRNGLKPDSDEYKNRTREGFELLDKANGAGCYNAGAHRAMLELAGYPWEWRRKQIDAASESLLPGLKANNPWCQFMAAKLFALRQEGKELVVAEKLLRASAAAGLADAQYILARELMDEDYTHRFDRKRWLKLKPDNNAGAHWAQLAADQDSLSGMTLLAAIYQQGCGSVRRDDKLANKWCEKAIAANSSQALLLRSMFHYYGEADYPVNKAKIAEDAWQAAKRYDHGEAFAWLGALYADNEMPAAAPYFDLVTDRIDGKLDAKHHALLWFFLGSLDRTSTAEEGFQEFVKPIRENPNTAYWQLFQKKWPGDAKLLAEKAKVALSK